MKNYIDLHMHSNYSDDGEFTPTELVDQCKRAGILIMAISDHNCVRANEEAKKVAEKLGIKYISAIEMDCTYQGVNLHVIGYKIDDTSYDFALVEENIREQGNRASKEQWNLTKKMGFQLSEEELNCVSDQGYWKGFWNGETFAEVLLQKEEYLDNEILKPYRMGGIRGDNPYANFYWDYYAQGKPCYAEMKFPSLEETIDIIKRNGGKAVLAHPGNNLNGKRELFGQIVSAGIDGIEVYSSYHDREMVDYFYQKALDNKLFITCGSDYHGKIKPSIRLGQCGCDLDQKEIELQLKF